MSASLVGSEMCIRDRSSIIATFSSLALRTKCAGRSSPVYSSHTGREAANLEKPSDSFVTDASTTE
eukprot:5791431-Alexandrium_andersonii.AAC.1